WRSSRTQYSAARARSETCLDQERHQLAFRHGLAVETLDGEALRAASAHVLDERRERRPKPRFSGLAQRDERAPAALDEERARAVAAGDALAADAVAGDDPVPLEQQLSERPPVGLSQEEAVGERPAALRGRDRRRALAGEAAAAVARLPVRLEPPSRPQRRPRV